MQATHLFLGACALASVGGVVGGTTINTRPIQHGGIGMDEIHRPAIAVDAAAPGIADQVALPDHYALQTPAGRFQVGELSTRGLYAQRRFGWRDAAWTPSPDPLLDEPEADANWSASPADLGDVSVEPVLDQSIAPAAISGSARMIDVQSELASQSD